MPPHYYALLASIVSVVLTSKTVDATCQSSPYVTFVPMLTAANYEIIAGSGITGGSAVINGSMAISPNGNTSVTGFFPPAIFTGVLDAANLAANQSKLDLTAAYTFGHNFLGTATAIPAELGSVVLSPGIYTEASSTFIISAGTLTLNGGGNTSASFTFIASSTLTTASSTVVLLTNGTQGCNVVWIVVSSATLGSSSTFAGNIIALTSISVGTTAYISGRLEARNGAVTFAGAATVVPPTCPTVCVSSTAAVSSSSAGTGATTPASSSSGAAAAVSSSSGTATGAAVSSSSAGTGATGASVSSTAAAAASGNSTSEATWTTNTITALAVPLALFTAAVIGVSVTVANARAR